MRFLHYRQSNASYQYTLLSDDLSALREWEPKIRKALAALPELADVNSDQQDNGAEMDLVYDRDTMSRLGISVQDANNLLNNAFGQRQISTISQPLNQYKVVMEVDPAYTQDVSALDKMFVINSDGKPIPLAYFAPKIRKTMAVTIPEVVGRRFGKLSSNFTAVLSVLSLFCLTSSQIGASGAVINALIPSIPL